MSKKLVELKKGDRVRVRGIGVPGIIGAIDNIYSIGEAFYYVKFPGSVLINTWYPRNLLRKFPTQSRGKDGRFVSKKKKSIKSDIEQILHETRRDGTFTIEEVARFIYEFILPLLKSDYEQRIEALEKKVEEMQDDVIVWT